MFHWQNRNVMKKISSLFCILAFTATMLYGQTGPKLQFVEQSIDLGTLYTDSLSLIRLEVAFINAGDQPLLVSQARGCCGTRVRSYTSTPLNPGEKGMVQLEFRLAPRPQSINRSLTITSNDESGPKIMRIKGKVLERKIAESS